MHESVRRFVALVLLALPAPVFAQSVFLVDDDPGGDYGTIQAAVVDVPDGSVLLIGDGLYQENVFVDAKPLTIVAEDGASVSFIGQLEVANLAPGDSFVLTGFDLDSFGNTNETLRITDCAGTVWIEDVAVTGGFPNIFSSADTVIVSNSSSVVFAGCSLLGGSPGFEAPGGAALRATSSSVHAFDCSLTGGSGTGPNPQTGGSGVLLTDGFLFASESAFVGGPGSPGGSFFQCANGGPGGTGIVLAGTTPSTFLLNVQLEGGAGGIPTGPGTCLMGPDGVPSVVGAGTLTQVSGAAHAFQAQSPVAPGQPVQLDFVGAAGDFAWYLFSEDDSTLFLAGVFGTLTLDFPLFAVPVGTLGPAGTASATPAAPPLLTGVEGSAFFLQSLFFDGALFTLSEPAVLIVLQ